MPVKRDEVTYAWEIKTADIYQAGTDSNISLTLQGDLGKLAKTAIQDPNVFNNFERNEINHGKIVVQDLGFLKSGKLISDKSLGGSDWAVDYIRIVNENDGRTWLCNLGGKWIEGDAGGEFTLNFTLTDRGRYDEMRRQAQIDELARQEEEEAEEKRLAREAEDRKAKLDKADLDAQAKREKARADADKDRAEAEIRRKQLELETEIARAQAELDLATKRADLEARQNEQKKKLEELNAKKLGVLRTYEIIVRQNGTQVAWSQALNPWFRQMGGTVSVGDAETDGAGLAGTPGQWVKLYPNTSPSNFGQDATRGVLAWNGSRGEALSAQQLSQLCGADWRSKVYV